MRQGCFGKLQLRHHRPARLEAVEPSSVTLAGLSAMRSITWLSASGGKRRSQRIVQRLELCEQRRHVLTHLYLSEEDADRAVRVDEEVGAQSAGPADAAALRSLCLHGHAETPSRAVPKPREEAVRGLARRRHLVAGHLL